MNVTSTEIFNALTRHPHLMEGVYSLLVEYYGSKVKPGYKIDDLVCPRCREIGKPFATWDGEEWFYHHDCSCTFLQKNIDPPDWPFLTSFPSTQDWQDAGFEVV